MRPGAARGPPGIAGAVGRGASRGEVEFEGFDRDVAIGGGRFVSSLVGDWGLDRPESPFSLRTLVLRPREAKKPVPEPFAPGRSVSGDLVGDERSVDERIWARDRLACAREG